MYLVINNNSELNTQTWNFMGVVRLTSKSGDGKQQIERFTKTWLYTKIAL